MTVERHYTDFPNGIPVNLWGRDHLSTLLYAETRAVDHKGILDPLQMRCDITYPTVLSDDSTVHMHTDYDCLKDAAAVGFLHPADHEADEPVVFTDAGWTFVHALRRKRAEPVQPNVSEHVRIVLLDLVRNPYDLDALIRVAKAAFEPEPDEGKVS